MIRFTLLTSTLLAGFALALPAFAQLGSPTADTPLTTTTGVPNGQNSGTAMPDTGSTYRGRANLQNSGRASASGTPVVAPDTPTGARPGNVIGTDSSLPTSSQASNIDRADTRSTIAPRLPSPSVGPNASPEQLLAAARQALRQNRTGVAQQALEMAETRMLDRSTVPDAANQPDADPRVKQVTDALAALSHGDRASAGQLVTAAMGANGGSPTVARQ